MTSCLRSSFVVVAGANTIRLTVAGHVSNQNYDIPPGTYFWPELAAEIEGLVSPALPGSLVVTQTEAGRPVITTALVVPVPDITLHAAHSAWTLPPELLGIEAATVGPATAITAPHVPRYGWYPQSPPMVEDIHRIADAYVQYSSDGRRDGRAWTTDDGYEVIGLRWDLVDAVLVTLQAAADDRYDQATLGLTLGDPWAPWERFALDLMHDHTRHWRYYPDMASPSYYGPYAFPDSLDSWQDPMSFVLLRERARAQYEIDVPGRIHIP